MASLGCAGPEGEAGTDTSAFANGKITVTGKKEKKKYLSTLFLHTHTHTHAYGNVNNAAGTYIHTYIDMVYVQLNMFATPFTHDGPWKRAEDREEKKINTVLYARLFSERVYVCIYRHDDRVPFRTRPSSIALPASLPSRRRNTLRHFYSVMRRQNRCVSSIPLLPR